jgi:hypothetical protein
VGHKPEMHIEHSFRNTGTRAIHTVVYDHNFLVLDNRPTDAGYTITVPFAISTTHPPNKDLAEIRKNQIVFLKTLEGEDTVYLPIQGFGASAEDYHIRIENSHAKAGMTITADRPLAKMALWTIRSVLSLEPFVEVSAEPGGSTSWKYTYVYDTLGR